MSGSECEESEDLKDWWCGVCCSVACDPLQLEYQLLPRNRVFLEDSNGDVWLFCIGCRLRYHMKCVDNIPRNITAEELGPDYLCSDCGWCILDTDSS